MKRTIIGALCLALLCAMAAPAFALETKLSGFYNVRGITDNIAARNNYIGELVNNAKDESLVDQRLRLKLNAKVNEYLSFVYYTEVDMQFGDEQYSNSGRNDGGGIGSDTTNLETKHLYIDVKTPDMNSSFRLGMQGVEDHYDYSFFAADMAGITYNTSVNDVDLSAGWYKLGEGGFQTADDITLWALQTTLVDSENFKLGADYYYYQNQGAGPAGGGLKAQQYASFFGTADIDAVDAFNSGTNTWSGTRGEMNLHYFGGHTEYRLENVVLTGWINVNTGSVDDLTINGSLTDVDVQGYAASVKAGTNIGHLKLNLRGTYFSGDDDLSDGEADFIVNPLATESFAFATDGFMIFTPDVNWDSVGQYGFAMVDAAWAGYGLAAVNLTASYKPTHASYVSGGIGYFSSLEDTTNDDRQDRNGTGLGTEIFLRAGFKMAENLDLSLNGAYAWLGDFYDNHGGGLAANTATSDIEDPYEVYAMASLSF